MGGDKYGAACTAIALTQTAHTDKLVSQLGMDVSDGYQLQRDIELSDRLYTLLRSEVGNDVSVGAIERRFRFKWREVDLPMPGMVTRRLDPYFAQHISATIAQSFHDFLFTLPSRIAALPGLNTAQRVETMTPQLNHACNVLYNRLLPLLAATTSPATHELLVQEARACAAELTALHTNPMRQFITEQIKSVRVLQSICTAAMSDEPIADLLYQRDDQLQLLATQPPHQLLDELSREKIPFAELAEFICSSHRRGVRGAASLPPSLAVREMAVQKWAKQYGEVVLACLVPVRAALNKLSTAPDDAHEWHGVLVADGSALVVNVAMQTGGPSAAVPCPALLHSYATNNTMLVATCISEPVAMLVPRMVRVVWQLIEQSHLSVRKVKSDTLIPLVRRWASEAIVQRDRLREQGIELPDVPQRGTETNTDESSSESGQDASEAHDAMDIQPPPAQVARRDFGPRIESGNVPLSLERDYAILVCARDLLLERGGTASIPNGIFVLFVKAVCSRVMIRAYDSLKASERSTIQSVGWVFTKVATNFEDTDDVHYWKIDQAWLHGDMMPKPKSAGLVMTQAGVQKAIDHLNSTIHEMRTNGTIFAKTWFPSRSSRSHSRRSLWQRRHGAHAQEQQQV